MNHGVSRKAGIGTLWISVVVIHRSPPALAPRRGSNHGRHMALPGDPAALDAAARHINRHADDLRARACKLAAAADGVRWHSTAAGAFRRDVRGLASGFRRAADKVDEAADALRRHTATVRHVRAAIAAAEHAAASTVNGIEHVGAGVAHALGF